MLGRFLLRRYLGQGSCGEEIWTAYNEVQNRPVTLQFVPTFLRFNDEALEEIRDEIRENLRIDQQGFLKYRDFVQSGGLSAIEMEALPDDAMSLAESLNTQGAYPVMSLLGWVEALCCKVLHNLHTIHSRPHGDLRLQNLFSAGPEDPLFVIGIGTSRACASRGIGLAQTFTSETEDFLCTIPPERQEDPTRIASIPGDLYSLGAILYHLVTGAAPAIGASQDDLSNGLRTAVPEIPTVWEEKILQCLQEDAAARPESVFEVGRILSTPELLTSGPPVVEEPPPPEEVPALNAPAAAGIPTESDPPATAAPPQPSPSVPPATAPAPYPSQSAAPPASFPPRAAPMPAQAPAPAPAPAVAPPRPKGPGLAAKLAAACKPAMDFVRAQQEAGRGWILWLAPAALLVAILLIPGMGLFSGGSKEGGGGKFGELLAAAASEHYMGNHSQALHSYTDFLEKEPGNLSAHLGRASCYFENGDYRKAADDYTEALDLKGDMALTHNARARCYQRLGRLEEAEADFQAAANLGVREGGIGLKVTTDKSSYREGESVKVKVRVGEDCHLRVYNYGPTGKLSLIFPNRDAKVNRLKRGQSVIVSLKPDTLNEDTGNAILMAVASGRGFTDAGATVFTESGEGAFIELGRLDISDLTFLGMNLTSNEHKTGQAHVIYQYGVR